jgi:omega-6 fatty acid desaturase (delta-12 desaturase)
VFPGTLATVRPLPGLCAYRYTKQYSYSYAQLTGCADDLEQANVRSSPLDNTQANNTRPPARADWQAAVARYQRPDLRRSLWQLANTVLPYGALWYLMVQSLAYSYWLTLGLAVIAGGLLLRIFILFHDCGHGSFFRSRRANNSVGILTGLLVFTPYYQWRHQHAVHHATASDLDRRGVGDIFTLTVREYLGLSRWGQLRYRLFRHPAVLLGLGPLYSFLVTQRFAMPDASRRERVGVYATNVALATGVVGVSMLIGVQAYLLVQLPVMIVAATAGVWLFYVQHQFEDAYWAEHESWDYTAAAIQGSSYLRLPKLLQWFTGNIGLHHIHHLSARIPNYALQRCHDENPQLQAAHVLTIRSGMRTLALRLWDEEARRMISFRQLAARRHLAISAD